MAHLRAQIFDAIKALLVAIPEFSGVDKVARGRTRPIRQEALPAITLTWFDGDETATIRPFAGADGAPGYDRTLPISIVVHLRDEDAEIEFDRLAASIETAMAGDIPLDGLAIEALLQSSRLYVDPKTGISLAVGRLVYAVVYKARADDPSVPAL